MPNEKGLRFERYRKGVRWLANQKVNFPFPNSSAKHAAVVLSNVMRTTNDILFFDDKLDGDIAYQDTAFIHELKKALTNSTDKAIKIVIRDYFHEGKKQRLLDEIRNISNTSTITGSLDVRVASFSFRYAVSKFTKTDETRYDGLNFAIGDNEAYRLEYYDKNRNYKAKCNFNDPSIAKPLREIFDNNFNSCTPISI